MGNVWVEVWGVGWAVYGTCGGPSFDRHIRYCVVEGRRVRIRCGDGVGTLGRRTDTSVVTGYPVGINSICMARSGGT